MIGPRTLVFNGRPIGTPVDIGAYIVISVGSTFILEHYTPLVIKGAVCDSQKLLTPKNKWMLYGPCFESRVAPSRKSFKFLGLASEKINCLFPKPALLITTFSGNVMIFFKIGFKLDVMFVIFGINNCNLSVGIMFNFPFFLLGV